MDPTFAWVPSPESIRETNLYALMQERGATSYAEIHAWSVREPEAFWERTIRALQIVLRKPYERLLDLSQGAAHAQWLVGAELNIAESCFHGPPERPAIIAGRQGACAGETWLETMTTGELEQLTNRVANGLRALGLRRGDAIAIDMPMTAESVAVYLGILKIGATVVSIPDSLPPEEIARRLRIGGAQAVFTQDVLARAGKTLPMYEKVCAADAPLTIVLGGEADEASHLRTGGIHPSELHLGDLRPGDLRWLDFLSSKNRFEAVPCAPGDATNILFSSGTTGEPKAIPWDHTTPIKCGADAMYHQDVRPGDVVCWPTNLGWMMGPWLVYAALLNRATVALYEGSPTERGFCEFVQNAGVTVLGLVPSIVKSWRSTGAANKPEESFDWSRLRCYSSSGEASDPDDYAWLMRLNQTGQGQPDGSTRPVIEYCGGTEIGGGYAASTMIAPHRPAEFNAIAMGSDVLFLNQQQRPCSPGEIGEVFIRPPSIGLSTRLLNADNEAVYYANSPVIDGEPLRRHGDQVIVGEDGRFRSAGRADDAMNLGGIKVGSVEIERTLNLLPSILETAAVAVPPAGGGPDRLVIFAVLKPGCGPVEPDALRREMQQAIREHLNPLFHIADLVLVESLPRTASNKVMRKELRKQYGTGQRAPGGRAVR